MQKKLALIATAACLGFTVTACSGTGADHRLASITQAPGELAPQVEMALSEGNFSRALKQAEALVAAAPQDAGYRTLLGRAYLANGRYASARTAFADAMALGSRDTRTIISLALCEIALGNGEAARALLVAHVDHVPLADYGLAMAMAGDAREGARALLAASRQPDATAQTRQNLAYAFALGGAWGQARLIAGQDLTAREAERRVGQWSQPSFRDDPRQRVAALTGVKPRGDDAGMPVHLALEASAPVAVAMAHVVEPNETAAEVQAAPETSVRLVDVPAANAEALQTPRAAPLPELARILTAAPMIALPQAAVSSDETPRGDVASRAEVQPQASPVPTAPISDWVVQLGAFDSASVAKAKWRAMSRAQTMLAGFQDVHSELMLDGRVFHRVAVRGFADRAEARALCKRLAASGQSCFVRKDDGGAVSMARAGGQERGVR